MKLQTISLSEVTQAQTPALVLDFCLSVCGSQKARRTMRVGGKRPEGRKGTKVELLRVERFGRNWREF